MTKEQILEVIKESATEHKIVFGDEELADIEKIGHDLEGEGLNFGIYESSDSSGSDYWLRAEYYSQSIKHTIVINCDFNSTYEDAEDMAETVFATQQEVEALENRLKLIK